MTQTVTLNFSPSVGASLVREAQVARRGRGFRLMRLLAMSFETRRTTLNVGAWDATDERHICRRIIKR